MRQIGFNGKRYTLEWFSDRNNATAQRQLQNAAKKVVPTCHCVADQALPLYISHKGNTYYLAKKKNTGSSHAGWCDFSPDETATGTGGILPALIERNGRSNVNIDSPLTRAGSPTTRTGAASSPGKPSVSRATWTLRGLLEEMWDRAQLNKWFPQSKYPRRLSSVNHYLMEEARHIDLGRRKLHEILVLPCFEKKAGQNWKTIEEKAKDKDIAIIVIGKLERVVPSMFPAGGQGLRLAELDHTIWMPKELSDWASNQKEVQELEQKNRQIMVICTVFRDGNVLNAGSVGFRRVSLNFIPVDSGYELKVADKLVEAERFFKKPLRHRCEETLPDFVLLDMDPVVVMEVFGMENDHEYNERKKEKLEAYRRQGTIVWTWSPASQTETVPDIPARNDAKEEEFGTEKPWTKGEHPAP